jgi:hypothetical protein
MGPLQTARQVCEQVARAIEIGVAFIRTQLGGPASQPVGDLPAGGQAEPFSFGLE